jgi:hypothetical protein
MTFKATDLVTKPVWTPLLNAGAYNLKLFELASVNFVATFKYACNLSRVKSPQEFADVVTNQMREQCEALSEQFEELSATDQGASSKNDAMAESGLGD